MRNRVLSDNWFRASVFSAMACASTGPTRPADTAAPSPEEHARTHSPMPAPLGPSPGAAAPVAASSAPVAQRPSDSRPAATPRGAGDAEAARAERVAYEKAKPVFASYCAPCHTGDGDRASKSALSHFSMDSYPFGGHHARQVTHAIRRVLGASGSKPTMPRDRPGAVQGEDLLLILAWAEAHDRAHAGSEPSQDDRHSGGGHHD